MQADQLLHADRIVLCDIDQIGTELDVVANRKFDSTRKMVYRSRSGINQLAHVRRQLIVRKMQNIEIDQQRSVARMQIADSRIVFGEQCAKQCEHTRMQFQRDAVAELDQQGRIACGNDLHVFF